MMLRWMCGHSRRVMIRNEAMQGKVGVAFVVDNMEEVRLRWFWHVRKRSSDALVWRCERLAI